MRVVLARFGILVVGVLVFFIGGCGVKPFTGKVDKTPYATLECNRELSRGLEIDKNNLIDKIEVYKSKRKMYAYRGDKLLYTFRMSIGKNGDKGNKERAGDYRTPEGSYSITRKKCDPRLYKSLLISYPNSSDIARARAKGLKSGGYITIHGQPKWNADGRGDSYTLTQDWTEGCMAIPNRDLDKLWSGVRHGTKIAIHP